MPTPQPGIVENTRPFSTFSVWHLNDLAKNARPALAAVRQVRSRVQQIQKEYPQGELTVTVGFGPPMWTELSSTRPRNLHPFVAQEHEDRSMPKTGGDLLLVFNSHEPGINYDAARPVYAALDSLGTVETTHGFRYRDSRDLIGFIDGTANPKGDERAEVALIGSDDPEFAGGSYVITQRYVHDLKTWEKLSPEEQEKVIGRTKPDSEELPEDRKPKTAHISRVEIEEDGKELSILRHSLPYAQEGGDSGLFFIAYARDLSIFDQMLARMMGTGGDGAHDHLLHFTRAVTGAYFFAPSQETLQGL